MISRRTILVAGLTGATSTAGIAWSQTVGTTSTFDAVWHGELVAGGQTLRLRLEVRQDGNVALFSLDQGGTAIPGRVITRTTNSISFEIPTINARYDGRLIDADRIEGTFTQGSALPLVFVRGEPPSQAAVTVFQSPVQPLTLARLEAYRQAVASPGLAAASMRAGGSAMYWSTGLRRVGSSAQITDDDVWHIGSQTKSMTATLVARLVEAGQISWETTVAEVLGASTPQMRPEYQMVTFRHLLSHRSGLPANIAPFDLARFSRDLADPRQERRAYARLALALPPKGAPGTVFEYSNNGYVVAGAMLEAKLNQSWETLIRRHVFEPLGLSSAGFGPPSRADTVDQPYGHRVGASGPEIAPTQGGRVDNPAVLGPAGRVHITLRDLITYLSVHQGRTSFLRPQTWDALHNPPFGGDYAMGWVIRPNGIRWHNGSNTLWYSEMAFGADDGLIAAACSNYVSAGRAVSRALAEAARAASNA